MTTGLEPEKDQLSTYYYCEKGCRMLFFRRLFVLYLRNLKIFEVFQISIIHLKPNYSKKQYFSFLFFLPAINILQIQNGHGVDTLQAVFMNVSLETGLLSTLWPFWIFIFTSCNNDKKVASWNNLASNRYETDS